MAKIRDLAVTIEAAAVTSMVCEMPEHETGDLLLAFVNKDSAVAFTTPSGWTALETQLSAGAAGGVYAKRAASSSETVTFTLSSETCLAVIVAVKNVYGSTVSDACPDSAKSGSDDSTLPLTGVGITPSYNNSLILHWLSTDTGFGPAALPPWVNLFTGDAGANSGCLSYTHQRTAAAITAPDHWGASQDDSRGFAVAVRDDGNDTEVDPYVQLGTTPATLISALAGLTASAAAIAANMGTFVTASPMDIATIGGKTLTWVAGAAAADSGYIPFRASTRMVATSSKTVLYGQELRFTSAADLTALSGVVFGTVRPQVPRDYLDCGKSSTGGILIGFADADNDYRFWTIAAQFAKTTIPSDRQNFAIEVNLSDSEYAESGTVGWSAVNDLYLAGAGYYGQAAWEFNELWLLGVTQLAGGRPSYPLNFFDMELAINNGSGPIPLFVRSGSAATVWTQLKIGGGDPIHIEVSLRTFQWPRKADGTDYLDFHVSNNKMGIEFHGQDRGSGDVDHISFIGCVFTSDSPYYWKFNASHDADAEIDFTGTTVVGATVTLQSTVALAEMAFTDCPSFTLNGATLDSIIFTGTKVSAATPAAAAGITNSSFTSRGTGHAIEIGGTAANITLTGNTFSGYAASDGSTGNEAIYVNIASGSMTITIGGGGNTPSIRTAGATVTVVNNVILTVTDIVAGSDVVIYEAGTTTVLDDSQENAGTTFQYTYDGADAGDSIDIGVFKAGYVPFYIRGFELGATDASIPVSQVVDRAYIA